MSRTFTKYVKSEGESDLVNQGVTACSENGTLEEGIHATSAIESCTLITPTDEVRLFFVASHSAEFEVHGDRGGNRTFYANRN